MPQPGWYADPDGTPERLRWWDGTRWSEHVHGGNESGEQDPQRRGVWPWVALVGVAGLVVTVGFGLGTGMFGGDDVLGTAVPPPTPPTQVRQAPATATTSPSVRPTPTATHTRSPKSSPTMVPSTLSPDPWAECPPTGDDGTLSDGQLVLTLPASWLADDGPAWLLCAKAGTSPRQDASVTLGVSDWPTATLEEAARYIWAMSLTDLETYPESHTSVPVTVGGLDGWRITGSIPLDDRLHELTVVVVDAGWGEPSVVVTLAGAQDKRARADITAILDSLYPA